MIEKNIYTLQFTHDCDHFYCFFNTIQYIVLFFLCSHVSETNAHFHLKKMLLPHSKEVISSLILSVLPVLVWDFSKYSSFLPVLKQIHSELTGDPKLVRMQIYFHQTDIYSKFIRQMKKKTYTSGVEENFWLIWIVWIVFSGRNIVSIIYSKSLPQSQLTHVSPTL